MKPVVVVSRCLEFAACRYDGKKVADSVVRRMTPFVRFVPVCPEVEIGLGTPRDPIRVVERKGARRLVQPSTGAELGGKMRRFAAERLGALSGADGFLLKSRSPSCGPAGVKIYADARAASPASRGAGFFAEAVLERFPHLAVEDEARLADPKVRRRFFAKLFCLAAFRKAKKTRSAAALAAFHGAHRSFFGRSARRALENAAALRRRADAFDAYEKILFALLARPPRSLSRALLYPAELEGGC